MTEPTEVKDIKAEKGINGIKWNARILSILLTIAVSAGGYGFVIANNFATSFATEVIDGMKAINTTLIEVRKEISLLAITGELNKAEINHNRNDIKDIKIDVNKIRDETVKNSIWIDNYRKRPNYAGE